MLSSDRCFDREAAFEADLIYSPRTSPSRVHAAAAIAGVFPSPVTAQRLSQSIPPAA